MGHSEIIKRIYTLTAFLCIGIFAGCALSPTQPELKNEFRYTVTLSSQKSDSIHVTLAIHIHGKNDSIHLLAPPLYADNPWLEQASNNFHNLLITDAHNNNIPYTLDSIAIGLHKSMKISFPCSDTLLRVSYTITLDYVTAGRGPIPYLDGTSGYWKGSYIFAIPFNSTGITDIWRTPYNFSVSYKLGITHSLHGDPLPTVYFRNSYELLFSTNTLNGEKIAQGRIGSQQFQFISAGEYNQMSPAMVSQAKLDCEIILKDITTVFNPITSAPMSVLLAIDSAGGLEGMYAFSIIPLNEDDSNGWFQMVLAHEIIHFWIGLRVGEYEDPWWKEGTTTYLGYLFAIRNKLSTDYFITKYLLADLSGDECVNKYALADPVVRKLIYADVDNCETLVYYKGAQVTMLIDRKIREESGESTSIDKILGEFVKAYDGKAFYRQEYISFIKEMSGADISDIVEKYVITSGTIPDSVLNENCNALISMEAFGKSILSAENVLINNRYIPRHY